MIFRTLSNPDSLTFKGRHIHCALLIVVGFCGAGCAGKQVHVRPWHGNISVRPNLPGSAVAQQGDAADAPELSWDFPPPPTALSIARQPVRPRVLVPQSSEPDEAQRPAAPSLAPQLSAQEITSAEQQMNDSLSIAQKNLDAAKGRKLNAAQSDLASKVTSFLQEAKDAAREGDWTRARNLAKKAQVLSEELAAGF